MTPAPRIDSYEWAGGRAAMLRFGPEDSPGVALALPLFEEANRTRALGVAILRALASRGIAGVLPELPGQGESELPTSEVRLADLRAAFAAVPGAYAIAIRSGAMLVDDRTCWMLSPQDGPALLRELARIKGDSRKGDPVEIAGNLLGRSLLENLGKAHLPGESRGLETQADTPAALDPGFRRGSALWRTVRLTSDPRPADRHVDGPALWRRTEPDNDAVLVQALAADIADWLRSCAS